MQRNIGTELTEILNTLSDGDYSDQKLIMVAEKIKVFYQALFYQRQQTLQMEMLEQKNESLATLNTYLDQLEILAHGELFASDSNYKKLIDRIKLLRPLEETPDLMMKIMTIATSLETFVRENENFSKEKSIISISEKFSSVKIIQGSDEEITALVDAFRDLTLEEYQNAISVTYLVANVLNFKQLNLQGKDDATLEDEKLLEAAESTMKVMQINTALTIAYGESHDYDEKQKHDFVYLLNLQMKPVMDNVINHKLPISTQIDLSLLDPKQEGNKQYNNCLEYLGHLQFTILRNYPDLQPYLSSYSYPISLTAEPLIAPEFKDSLIASKLKKYYQERAAKEVKDIRSKAEDYIENVLKKDPLASQAFAKYKLMNSAKEILSTRGLESYHKFLNQNKTEICKNRTTALTKFIKGLGVVGATIFGFGVGGYFAYKSLFSPENTTGAKYIRSALTFQPEKKFRK